jgi:hypothetical protein
MKTTKAHRSMRGIAALGLACYAVVAFTPLGCGGIEQAPPRVPSSADEPRLPAITQERLRACVNDYGDQVEGYSLRVDARAQVDGEGRIQKVIVDGIPDTAPDLAACTRITLRDMAVPGWVLNLRPGQRVLSTNGQTVPMRNEAGNMVLVMGVLIGIGELAV